MAIPSFIFGTEGLAKTPQELAQMRAVADAMRKRRTPQTVGEGIAALGDGIASGLITLQANRAEKSGRESAGNAFSSIMSALSGSGGSPAPAGGGTGVSYSGNIPAADLETDPVNRRVNQGFAAFGDANAPENWAQIREGIFAGESGGDYDALFGFSNRPGGKFADTKLTDMTVDEALAFSDPSGPYGQWVKGQVGRVATPMGGYQVVGSTLRSAKEGLGLRGDEKMTPELQEQIGQHIYRTQGTGAWEGYKGPRQPSGQYASLNPSIAPEQPAMDPKTLLAQRLTKMQGQNVSANPSPEVAQAAPQTGVQRVAQAMPQQGGMDQQTLQLIDAMSNPYMSAGQKAVLGAMLDQRMQASDPLRQMQLEKGRLELEQMRNPTMKPMNVGEGQTLVNPQTGEVIFEGQQKAPDLPSAVREYEYAKEQGFPGTFQDWEASKKGGMSLQVDPATGQVSFQQGANIKPLTEGQSKDAVYATRAEGALPTLDKYEQALTSLGDTVAGGVPVVGNMMKSPEFQQAEQAGLEFLQAILRKDTGAAITPAETQEYGKVYLPRPGDTPETIAQKKQSRIRALEAIKAGMPPQAILAQEKALANTTEKSGSVDTSGAISAARAAIEKGAPRDAVIQRLKEAGIDPSGL